MTRIINKEITNGKMATSLARTSLIKNLGKITMVPIPNFVNEILLTGTRQRIEKYNKNTTTIASPDL